MVNRSGASQERARAARILVDVIYRRMTTDQSFGLLVEDGDREPPSAGSPLLKELVYGTLRYYFILEAMLAKHLNRDFRSKDLDLRCLMLVGAYQLKYMRIPDHAVINETVNACRALRKPWARNLVNAVLRKVANESAAAVQAHQTERMFGLPEWIAKRLRSDFPDHADALMAATLDRAPMSLRINLSRTSPADYAAQLAAASLPAHPGWRPENLVLESPVPVRSLPGHAAGLVSVQDGGAMFAAPLLATAAPSGRILDACAAPGGKLFHLAELAPTATLTGLELKPERLAHLQREARRLGHDRIALLEGDATGSAWHDGMPYDAILLDAPCSGSGTLRRHPDIKLLRQPADLSGYADLQQQLLANLWQLLRRNGTLVYCTCSMFSEENDSVIETFLANTPDAQSEPIELPTGVATRHGWQLLPLPRPAQRKAGVPDKSVDGFYYARMTRQEKAR